jgi:hypothetical protein
MIESNRLVPVGRIVSFTVSISLLVSMCLVKSEVATNGLALAECLVLILIFLVLGRRPKSTIRTVVMCIALATLTVLAWKEHWGVVYILAFGCLTAILGVLVATEFGLP